MRTGVSILIAVVFVLAGVPHLWCACGCSPWQATAVAQQPVQQACPHCPAHQSRSTPQPTGPCECGNCDRIAAVVPDAVAMALASGFHLPVDFLPDAGSVQVVTPPTPTAPTGTGPPGLSSHPSGALPILLGHLLF